MATVHLMPVSDAGKWFPSSVSRCGRHYAELAEDVTAFVTGRLADATCEDCIRKAVGGTIVHLYTLCSAACGVQPNERNKEDQAVVDPSRVNCPVCKDTEVFNRVREFFRKAKKNVKS